MCSSRRSSSRTARSRSSATRRRSCAPGRQAEVARHRAHRGARAEHGPAIRERIQRSASARPARSSRSSRPSSRRRLSMDSTEEDIVRQIQLRSSLTCCSSSSGSRPSRPGARPVRGRPARRSPRPSRTRRSSSRPSARCSSTGSSTTVELPFPVGPATVDGDAPAVKDSLTKSYVKKAAEAIYKDLVRKKIAVEKRRPDGRGNEDIRPINVRGRHQPALARLRPVHARPDAGAQLAHPRHRQGGPAHRRPVARAGPPLHAPLQLPALLGRGDGLHARPEAARHRPRRPRPAGAPGDDPAHRGLPVHDPHRLGDARVERLVVDGLGLRLDARR